MYAGLWSCFATNAAFSVEYQKAIRAEKLGARARSIFIPDGHKNREAQTIRAKTQKERSSDTRSTYHGAETPERTELGLYGAVLTTAPPLSPNDTEGRRKERRVSEIASFCSCRPVTRGRFGCCTRAATFAASARHKALHCAERRLVALCDRTSC